MFQNQINNIITEIKSYYSVLSSNKIHKIEQIISKNDFKGLLAFCKLENTSIFKKIEGKLELLISIIDDFNISNDEDYIYSFGLNENFSDYMIVENDLPNRISIEVWGYNEYGEREQKITLNNNEALKLAKSIIRSI